MKINSVVMFECEKLVINVRPKNVNLQSVEQKHTYPLEKIWWFWNHICETVQQKQRM